MRAADAQLRRPRRQGQASHGLPFAHGEAERDAHDVWIELAVGRQVAGVAAEDLDAVDERRKQSFQVRVAILEHEDTARAACELAHERRRNGVRTDVQVRRLVVEIRDVLGQVRAGHARCHDAEARVAGRPRVGLRHVRPGPHVRLPVEQSPPLPPRVVGQQDPRGRRVGLAQGRGRPGRAVGHRPAAVRHPGDQTQEDGYVEPLRHVEGLARQVVGLLHRGGFEARDAREVGVEPAVLLVLRAVHAGVVGDGGDQAAVHRDERGIYERVGRDVQADVLHRHERAASDERHAERRFVRGLFVAAPRGVDAAAWPGRLDEGVEDFRGRRTRIAVHRRDTRVQGGEGDGLAAKHDRVGHDPELLSIAARRGR